MKRALVLTVTALCLLAPAPDAARAAVWQIEFEGIADGGAVGTPFSGSLRYDDASTLSGSFTGSNGVNYNYLPSGLPYTATVGATAYSTTSTGTYLSLTDGPSSAFGDIFRILANIGSGQHLLSFRDPTGNARTGGAIPTGPELAGLPVVRFQTTTNTGNVQGTAAYRVSLIPSAVPEPGTWAAMIAGFGLIGASMRNRPTRPAFGVSERA